MPTRENSNIRVCDIFLQNIVLPNNPDIFITTDTNDFYYNGAQYFCSDQIDIVNNDIFRLYHKIEFISPADAKIIINQELRNFLGNNIKELVINERDANLAEDHKCKLLSRYIGLGPCPEILVGQYKKIHQCSDLIQNYELQHNMQYDVIVKCRFDAGYNIGNRLVLSNYDFINNDVYVPSFQPPLIYDFYGFGNRRGMMPYLRLYDDLGSTLPNIIHMVECRRCGHITYFGTDPTPHMKRPCTRCGQTDRLATLSNITLSSEHHLYHIFQKLGIRYQGGRLHSYVYRYRDPSKYSSIDDAINNELKLKNVVIINHSPEHVPTNRKF
jgi:hypothetical protein